MSKRGENIRKRSDGRWEARYKTGTDPNGKPIYRSVYGKTYREAKTRRMEQMTSLTAKPVIEQKMSFQKAAQQWLEWESMNTKGATQYRYQYLLEKHILPEFGGISVERITVEEINGFLLKKQGQGRLDGQGGLSPAYVRSIALIIRAVMRHCAALKLCLVAEERIVKPQLSKREIPILSKGEQRRLVEQCRLESDGTAIGVLLSLYCGLRIGEICALSWDDLDMEHQIIHIRKTVSRIPDRDHPGKTMLVLVAPKTDASRRDVPICTWLLPVLKTYQKRQTGQYVLTAKEHFLSPRTYDDRFHRLLERAGIEKINYHALRHTFATRCIETGMDVKSLSELLGHSNTAVTLNTYVHSSMERKRNHLELLEF